LGIFDLSKEPVVLVHPDMGQRYFTFELADMYSNNFGYVGKRSTGTKAGAFLIAGPDWNGQKPDDVREVIRSRTPYALVFGRTFVEGPSDVAAVNKLQDQYRCRSACKTAGCDAVSIKISCVPAGRRRLEIN